MEEISNRTLAVLLVAAIIISLGGTILSLNRLMPQRAGQGMPTMMASSDAGYVNLSIAAGISITTADNNRINFGSCTPVGGAFNTINSDQGGASICTNGDVGSTAAKNITIRNNGNVNINVTMTASDVGKAHSGNFLPGATATSYIAFKPMTTWAGGYALGCYNNTYLGYNSTITSGHGWNDYQNITSTSTKYVLCGNLTYHATQNSFGVAIMIGMPQDVTTGHNNITLQLLASNTG